MSRIRVCLLVDTVAYQAGTERQVSETVARMDRSRFEVHLCCLENSPQMEDLAHYCQTAVFPVESLYTFNGLRQVRRFRKYLDQHGIEIVHAFMTKTAIFGVFATRKLRGRCVITSRLNTGYWYTPFYNYLFRYLNRYTTRVFANSEGARRIAMGAERLPLDKVDVVYQGVDMARFAPDSGDPGVIQALGIPPHAKIVGIVSNLRPVKDVGLFLRAAAIIAAAAPKSVFLIVGQGPLRAELGRLVVDLGISDRVFFADGRGTVPDYLGHMSIGCLSSHSEGFSNAILEYMAAGLPVVATDVGGNGEAIEEGVTGYLVRQRTPEAFAEPIIGLLRDEYRRATMGQQSFARCRELFDVAVTVRRLEDYYTMLVQTR